MRETWGSCRLTWRYKTGVPVMTKKNESLSSRISSHLIKTMTHWHHFHLVGCPSHCPISTYCIKSCHICCHCITSERLLSVLTHKLYKSASIWQKQEIQMYCHKEIALMWITLQYFLLTFSGAKIHIFHYIAKINTDMPVFLAIFLHEYIFCIVFSIKLMRLSFLMPCIWLVAARWSAVTGCG